MSDCTCSGCGVTVPERQAIVVYVAYREIVYCPACWPVVVRGDGRAMLPGSMPVQCSMPPTLRALGLCHYCGGCHAPQR